MQLTLARKIGGSFALLLIFTGIVSYIAAQAMHEGRVVSETTAQEAIPKLTLFNSLQGNLLLAAMNLRVFFEAADAASYERGQKFLRLSQENFKELETLNGQYPTPELTEFLQKYAALNKNYADSVASGFGVQNQADEATRRMLERGDFALQMFGRLIATMGETQRAFLADGNTDAVVQYSRNLVQASAFVQQMENLQRELLLAARRHDVKAFSAQVNSLSEIHSEAQDIRTHLLREECREMFDEANKAIDTFAQQAAEMIRLQIKRVELGQIRIKSYSQAYQELERASQTLSRQTIDTVAGATDVLGKSRRLVFIACVILLALGAAFSCIITRTITRPVTRTQIFARAVAQGKLDHELDVSSKDEIGLLADDLRRMVATLKENIHDANAKKEEEARRIGL